MTGPQRGPLARLRRQAWVFWAVIVATVVLALASVAYAGRSTSFAFPARVVVGMHPATEAAGGSGTRHQTVTVVQPNRPVRVLDATGEQGDPAPSTATPSLSSAPDDATPAHGAGPEAPPAPRPTDDDPTTTPPAAGQGDGGTTTTTTIPTTTTTTWGESDDRGSGGGGSDDGKQNSSGNGKAGAR